MKNLPIELFCGWKYENFVYKTVLWVENMKILSTKQFCGQIFHENLLKTHIFSSYWSVQLVTVNTGCNQSQTGLVWSSDI